MSYAGATGSGAALAPIVQGGQLVGATILSPGSNHTPGPAIAVPAPSGTSGPHGHVAAQVPISVVGDANYSSPGAIRTIVPAAGGLLGCGSGYTGSTVACTVGASPNSVTPTVTANVSSYVANIAVTSSSDSNTPPAISLSGGSPTRAAVVAPIMSGAVAGDTLTYSAPASWLTLVPYGTSTPLGGLQAATNAAITNNTGRREVGTAFAQTPTMLAGANLGPQPVNITGSTFCAKNLMHIGTHWTSPGPGAVTFDVDIDLTPLSWTLPASTILQYAFYNPFGGNGLDSMGAPAYSGPFTYLYDDPNVNTPAANGTFITSTSGSPNTTITPVPQSGDASPVSVPSGNLTITAQTVSTGTLANGSPVVTGLASTAALAVGQLVSGTGIPTGATVVSKDSSSQVTLSAAATVGGSESLTFAAGCITAVSLSGVSLASTYQGAGLYLTGGGGSKFVANVVVVAGSPTTVNVISAGSGYSTSGLSAVIYGTAVSGTAIASVFDVAYVTNPALWAPALSLTCANSSGTWTLGNPWVVAPLASGQPNLAIDRTKPFAMDDNLLSYLSSGGRSIGITRYMDRTQNFAGISNFALPSDLPDVGSGLAWSPLAYQRYFGCPFRYARYINTDPSKGPGPTGDGTYAGVTTKVYSHQAWGSTFNAPITATCALISGSPVVVPATMPGIMAGAAVSGAGIPAGAIVAFLGQQVIGAVTSGSPTVTGLASTAGISAGMPVYSTAFSNQTTVLSVAAGQLTLSSNATVGGRVALNIGATSMFTMGSTSGGLANATATGGAVTVTFQNPGYVPLPTTDNGFCFNNNFGSNSYLVMELRSLSPHGLRTGDQFAMIGQITVPYTGPVYAGGVGFNAAWQTTGSTTNGSAVVTGLTNANFYQPGSAITGTGIPTGTTILSVQSATQFTLSANATATGTPTLTITAWRPNPESVMAYVTGPYTVCFYAYVGGTAASPVPNGPQVVSVDTEIDLTSGGYPNGWVMTEAVPDSTANEPYEFGAYLSKQCGNSALWVNISPLASDALAALIARKIAGQIGPANPIYIQGCNEPWNSAFVQGAWLNGISTILSYTPSGTVLGYAARPDEPAGRLGGADALITAHLADAFTAAFVAAGGSSSQIHLVANSAWGQPQDTQGQLNFAAEWGMPVKHACVAPYLNTPSDWPIQQAFSPAGMLIGGGQAYPMGAINDFIRFWQVNSQYLQSYWQQHAIYCVNFGQPLYTGGYSASGTGSSLQGGSYYLYRTYLDGAGRETTVGLSQTGATIATGNNINVNLGQWPSWAQAMRVYISALGAAAGATPTSYVQIPRTSYGYGQPNPLTFGSFPNVGSPPTTNLAAANTPTLPTLVCYEGGIDISIPVNVELYTFLENDSMSHPTGRDAVYGWYTAMQQGCPTMVGGGATAACYYQLFDAAQFPDMWVLSRGVCQPPGPGTANSFATIQGGPPADGHDHNQTNRSTYFQGLVDFFSASSPAQPTPVPRTRRWFAGLTRTGVRLGS